MNTYDKNETLVLHADKEWSEKEGTASPAIYYSATFMAKDAAEFAEMANTPRHSKYYTRYGNPVHDRVIEIMADLEGTETALVTGSGMGAISTTLLALLQAGDHVVAQTRHYMGTAKILDEMLTKFGIEVTVVEQTDVQEFEKAIRPNTKLIIIETPANPTLIVTDLEAVASLAKQHDILVMADNTFASPLNQRPHDYGVDIIVHSATKYLGGHHDIVAGVVCTSNELAEKIWNVHTAIGSVLSPMDAWLLLRGLRTFPIRMERINENALALAMFLEGQEMVEEVFYPGLESHPQHELAKSQMNGYGAVIAFSVKGGYKETQKFVSSLNLTQHAVSLGGVESLVVHTAAMWEGALNEEQMKTAGIPANFVRFSVGLEHIEDLKKDVLQALQEV
ncbi:aminotransferase class I/II-fold pyridoxal phosphate-dependent enzyme [Oceanobacillus caeni]|uniref:Methionine gamma-lyase n=1 Tax=Oceanobacillus caeni TaxID=405946 RepID=A0ABR5MJ79_9BACI|nr:MULTISPECIES: aminotransferase class I/II-fold pyridoxal phosphate-dependent enzyme [Bacillaceae]KKE79908.1 methionine gamma-lyase [Bacilli bacterium VT-13-104]PZD84097.1 aminotransferase class I/II-fold pyridoxal phosphate-dependent enzyme [Bacilli bacterium]KPH75203.1 methionine gamma-lyase [Oceanobacillus caeni]MCR1835731.1 aminotransferase class I/II-fold pyridoxal phosphate-dependent enzyme [Oceanobacillus caeni]PZD85458.1 aminotransferase class I/II-fold pyridoxal phosphate-dependent 